MFNWDKLFDHIYCIHYLPYKERLNNIIRSLKNVGIYQSKNFSFFNTCDNFIYDKIYEQLLKMGIVESMTEDQATQTNYEGYIKSKNVFNLAINTYNLISQAKLLGYKRILIVEDDVTFLRDKNKIEEIMSDFPLDYDIVSMEYWFRNKDDFNTCFSRNRKINDSFYAVSKERLVNAGFVSYSDFGMEHFLNGMNQRFMNSDYFIPNQETFDDWKIKRCVSFTPVCVQRQEYTMNHVQNMHWNYGQIKLDLKNYEWY